VPAVKGGRERRRVADPARHPYGLRAERQTTGPLGRPIECHGEAAQQLRAERAVRLSGGGECILEQPDELVVDDAKLKAEESRPECKGGIGEPVRSTQPSRDPCCTHERRARAVAIAGAVLCPAQREEKLAASHRVAWILCSERN